MHSVLIIEDNATLCCDMKTILQMEGFEVDFANDGVTGIAKIREKFPDLVLCDIQMPGMDGHSVLEALKQDAALADLPFIFVTAQTDRVSHRRGMSAGADDYLTKPFLPEELVAAVVGRLNRIETLRNQAKKMVFQEEQAFLRKQITSRELEILLLVGEGYTSKEIANRLGIHCNTVQVHRTHLMEKLDTPNSACLARWAVIAGHCISTDK